MVQYYLTDKGSEYLAKLQDRLPEIAKTIGPPLEDYIILKAIEKEIRGDPEPRHTAARQVVRRLFEAGYIERQE